MYVVYAFALNRKCDRKKSNFRKRVFPKNRRFIHPLPCFFHVALFLIRYLWYRDLSLFQFLVFVHAPFSSSSHCYFVLALLISYLHSIFSFLPFLLSSFFTVSLPHSHALTFQLPLYLFISLFIAPFTPLSFRTLHQHHYTVVCIRSPSLHCSLFFFFFFKVHLFKCSPRICAIESFSVCIELVYFHFLLFVSSFVLSSKSNSTNRWKAKKKSKRKEALQWNVDLIW